MITQEQFKRALKGLDAPSVWNDDNISKFHTDGGEYISHCMTDELVISPIHLKSESFDNIAKYIKSTNANGKYRLTMWEDAEIFAYLYERDF